MNPRPITPQDWRLEHCIQSEGRDSLLDFGSEEEMRKEMKREAALGRDVWLIRPDGEKELPDGSIERKMDGEWVLQRGPRPEKPAAEKPPTPFEAVHHYLLEAGFEGVSGTYHKHLESGRRLNVILLTGVWRIYVLLGKPGDLLRRSMNVGELSEDGDPDVVIACISTALERYGSEDIPPSRADLVELLSQCLPFLSHAICSIPEGNHEVAKARKLIRQIDPIANAVVHAAFRSLPGDTHDKNRLLTPLLGLSLEDLATKVRNMQYGHVRKVCRSLGVPFEEQDAATVWQAIHAKLSELKIP